MPDDDEDDEQFKLPPELIISAMTDSLDSCRDLDDPIGRALDFYLGPSAALMLDRDEVEAFEDEAVSRQKLRRNLALGK